MRNLTLKPTASKLIRYRLTSNLIIMPIAMGPVLATRILFTFSWKESLLFWLILSLGGIIGSLFGQLIVLKKSLESLSVTISDEYVFGPGSWIGERKRLEIVKLDKAKSIHRNFYHRFFRLRNFWFLNGEKLQICESIYEKDQIKKMLEILQLEN